ncbi:MAG: hypothetical protein AAFO99_11085 [Bacteroidota bacterium]
MKKLLSKSMEFIKKVNSNIIIASTALFISICTLIVLVQEVRIMRVQQKASMYPYLTIGKVYNSKGFGITLKNSGNGLAKINSYQIYNDSVYFKDWFDILQVLAPESKKIDYSIISTEGNIRDEMVTPDEEVNLIFLEWTDETRILERRINSLRIKICYSSLLDDHWQVNQSAPQEMDDACILEIEKEFGS